MMSMPGFTAEVSLRPTEGRYQGFTQLGSLACEQRISPQTVCDFDGREVCCCSGGVCWCAPASPEM